MTQIFNAEGQQIPVHGRGSAAQSRAHGPRQGDERHGADSARLRCSSASDASAPKASGRPRGRRASRAAVGHATKAGLTAPPRVLRSVRLDDGPGAKPEIPTYKVGDHVDVSIFAVGDHVKVTGTIKGSRVPGRREAPQLRWRPEHAREHQAPPARLDRSWHGPVARHQGQAHAGALRRRAAHADASARRAHRRRASSSLHPRCSRRSQERDRRRPQAGLMRSGQ